MIRTLLGMVLGAAVIALGALNVQLALTPVDTSPITVSAPVTTVASIQDLALLPGAPRPIAEFRETLARPLFVQSRRPPEARPPAPETTAPPTEKPLEPPALRLTGIVDISSSGRRALIVSPGEPSGRWLPEGAEIDGWRLVSIERLAVQISHGGRLRQLDMQ